MLSRVWYIDYASRAWHKQSQFDLKTHVAVAEIKFLISSCSYCCWGSAKCTQEASGTVVKAMGITTLSTIFPSKTHRTIPPINRIFTTRRVMDLTRSRAPTQLRSTTLRLHLRRSTTQENHAWPTWQARDKATKRTVTTTRLLPFLRSPLSIRQSRRIRERRKRRMACTKEGPARN